MVPSNPDGLYDSMIILLYDSMTLLLVSLLPTVTSPTHQHHWAGGSHTSSLKHTGQILLPPKKERETKIKELCQDCVQKAMAESSSWRFLGNKLTIDRRAGALCQEKRERRDDLSTQLEQEHNIMGDYCIQPSMLPATICTWTWPANTQGPRSRVPTLPCLCMPFAELLPAVALCFKALQSSGLCQSSHHSGRRLRGMDSSPDDLREGQVSVTFTELPGTVLALQPCTDLEKPSPTH